MDWQDAMEDWSAYLREHDTEGEQALAAMVRIVESGLGE